MAMTIVVLLEIGGDFGRAAGRTTASYRSDRTGTVHACPSPTRNLGLIGENSQGLQDLLVLRVERVGLFGHWRVRCPAALLVTIGARIR